MNLGLLKFFLIVLFFSKQVFSEALNMKYANFKLLDKISNKLIDNMGIVPKVSIREGISDLYSQYGNQLSY